MTKMITIEMTYAFKIQMLRQQISSGDLFVEKWNDDDVHTTHRPLYLIYHTYASEATLALEAEGYHYSFIAKEDNEDCNIVFILALRGYALG